MTVEQLIEELRLFPPDLEIWGVKYGNHSCEMKRPVEMAIDEEYGILIDPPDVPTPDPPKRCVFIDFK